MNNETSLLSCFNKYKCHESTKSHFAWQKTTYFVKQLVVWKCSEVTVLNLLTGFLNVAVK